jgi:ADP-ribose pyrophosphatase
MPFTILDKKILYRGRFMRLWGTTFVDRAGQEQLWEWADKKDAVMILPITPRGEIVLVRQYRVPLQRYVIEMPAGLMDHPGEDPLATAQRELLEEVGYTAGRWQAFPTTPYSTGSSGNYAHIFVATDLTAAEAHHESTEDIEILHVPAVELTQLYLAHPDDLFDVKIFAAYHLAREMGLSIT